jgi:hypothetical protein
MGFTKNIFVAGDVAQAVKVNVNFSEIYEEIENFPGEHGSLDDDAVTTAKIQDDAVVWSKIAPSAYLTSKQSISDASDNTLVTSLAVKKYLETQ